jgi:hypothetical protein
VCQGCGCYCQPPCEQPLGQLSASSAEQVSGPKPKNQAMSSNIFLSCCSAQRAKCKYGAHYKPVCQRSIPGAEEAVTPIVLRSIRPTSLFVSTPSTMEPVGLEPTTNGLLTTSAFAATLADVRGLDYPFTRVGCCPSSLYTFLF